MPSFIQANLEDLYAGGKNIDSNPTGAFDTNGWSELRLRLPKFAHALGAFGTSKRPRLGTLSTEQRRRLRESCETITGPIAAPVEISSSSAKGMTSRQSTAIFADS